MNKSKLLAGIVVLVCMFVLAGCGTTVKHLTPSGRPEVTIEGVTSKQVGAQITNQMLNYGYNISKQTDFLIAFDRPVTNHLGAIFFGSQYDSTPNTRITYTLTDTNNATRAVADLKMVTNPGSAFERLNDMNRTQDSMRIQEMLWAIKFQLQQQEPRAWLGVSASCSLENLGKDKASKKAYEAWAKCKQKPLPSGVVVLGVVPGSPAEEAGVEPFDIITFNKDGQAVLNPIQLGCIISTMRPNDLLQFEVSRCQNGQLIHKNMKVVLGEHSTDK